MPRPSCFERTQTAFCPLPPHAMYGVRMPHRHAEQPADRRSMKPNPVVARGWEGAEGGNAPETKDGALNARNKKSSDARAGPCHTGAISAGSTRSNERGYRHLAVGERCVGEALLAPFEALEADAETSRVKLVIRQERLPCPRERMVHTAKPRADEKRHCAAVSLPQPPFTSARVLGAKGRSAPP